MLEDGYSLTEEDIITFLRWKVGDKKYMEQIVTRRGAMIDINSVKRMHSRIISNSYNNDNELYRDILDNNVYNIGPVYILSLVFLYSKGEEPIYDRFSEIALTAITEEKPIGAIIKYVDMPDKKSVNSVMKRYDDFKKKLTKVFDNRWKKDRSIDQALWTYGHLFN